MSQATATSLFASKESVRYMRRALALARRGSGFVSPNPMVGAILVKDGRIIGSGWHRAVGSAHAEVEAIRDAAGQAMGATLYVTLEPCNHFGRTPPCTQAVVDAGIARVVIAANDPNPDVCGSGAAYLREQGLVVEQGVLEEEARALNAGWEHWLKTKRPYVVAMLAVSLDGKIAFPDGSSEWLSSPAMRAHISRFRRHFDAVMLDAKRLIADDPEFARSVAPAPKRIIIDPRLELDPTARVYRPLALDEPGPSPIVSAVASLEVEFERKQSLELSGVEVSVFDNGEGAIDFDALLADLGRRGVQSIFCEIGAGDTHGLMIDGYVQRLLVYRVPTIVGDKGVPVFSKTEVDSSEGPRDPFSFNLDLLQARKVGLDALSIYGVRE